MDTLLAQILTPGAGIACCLGWLLGTFTRTAHNRPTRRES